MAKKQPQRIQRTGRLTPEQVAHDEAIRRQVRAEFPPLPRQPISDSLSDAVKQAIRQSDMTIYQIAKRAGISQIMISRFLSGERDIRLGTADKLANALGLKLISA